MELSEFNYALPENLIAHSPSDQRENSRLLLLNRHSGAIQHHGFSDLVGLLKSGDTLVFNDTKVLKAKLLGRKPSGAAIEVLLLQPIDDHTWEVLLKPAKRLKENDLILFSDDLSATVCQKHIRPGKHVLRFDSKMPFFDAINAVGHVPLPPYIDQPVDQADHYFDRYQTIFAASPGAIAAPTAGLHFSDSLVARCRTKGIKIETITLHIGYGTFKPIETDSIFDHVMHEERYVISPEVAERLNSKKEGRLIAVGTTVTRALESAYHDGQIRSGPHQTSLFITPGYTFNVIDGLVTNFHLPKSSLLVLVSAYAGTSHIQHAYGEAIRNRYRFFSFGDAMLIM